jgi:hypothetical protein
VKALGLEVDGQAQVSMNLVDTERTPLHRAFEAVRTEAAAHGVAPTWSELVGLVPERALLDAGARHVQLRGFTPQMLLEHRVREAVQAAIALGLRRVGGRGGPHARRRERRRAGWRARRLRSRRWSPASPSARRSTRRSRGR